MKMKFYYPYVIQTDGAKKYNSNIVDSKVIHLYLGKVRPEGNTTAEKLRAILSEAFTTDDYVDNASYVCSVEAGGFWYGWCSFTTMGVGANYATGIAYCNGEYLKLEYSQGVWAVGN